MSLSRQLRQVSQRFTITVVSLSVLSVGLLAATLYQTNSIRFNSEVSFSKLQSLVEGNSAVREYLEQEKDFEAHFITIANLVQNDQQQALGDALLIATVPVILIAAAAGFFVAKRLLRPIRESYESQERFLQDAAHEIRNPLAAMSLAIENASSEPATKELELLKTMNRQTKRLIRINEDLLYLERRSSGEQIQDVNISDLLSDVLDDLQASVAHKKLKVERSIQAGVVLKIDPKDFVKLSRNIIENAIKYSNDGGKIKIGMSKEKRITLMVTDNGIGIPKSELEQIGSRFYRAKNVGSVDGTGLGVAIVQKILNLYGGKIKFDSSECSGTTATIIL